MVEVGLISGVSWISSSPPPNAPSIHRARSTRKSARACTSVSHLPRYARNERLVSISFVGSHRRAFRSTSPDTARALASTTRRKESSDQTLLRNVFHRVARAARKVDTFVSG